MKLVIWLQKPLYTKAREIESKIVDTTNLATKVVLNMKATEIENQTPDTNSFITTPEFNRLTKVNFDARMEEAVKNLATKSEIKNALEFWGQKHRKNKKKTFNV